MPTMADLRDTLWKAADKLRGSMDAAQYKDFVLGLVFLKYVSDAFDGAPRADPGRAGGRRASPRTGSTPVPRRRRRVHRPRRVLGAGGARAGRTWPNAGAKERSEHRRAASTTPWTLIMEANPSLRRRAAQDLQPGQRGPAPPGRAGRPDQRRPLHRPRRPARPATCSARSTSTSWRSSPAPRASAAASSTPRASVVRVLVEVLEPYSGRVYDPCCGSGGMFVQAEKFVAAHHRRRRDDIAVYGQELNERTWRLAKMNLAIHGINGNLGARWGDTFPATSTPTCDRPTSSSPTRRSTCHGLGPQRRRPALAVRRPAGRQRQLRLAPAHHLQARRPAAAPAW